MKKSLTLIYLFLTVLGFAQDSEIYKMAFENEHYYKYL